MASDSSPADRSPPARRYHPTFLHARREFFIIAGVWACCLLWAVPYCYFNGYVSDGQPLKPGELSTVLGVPSWVFYGIAVPWLVADVFATWFCFCYMKDDDLGENGHKRAKTTGEADA